MLKLVLRIFFLVLALAVIGLTVWNYTLDTRYREKIFSQPEDIPIAQAALVPGASVIGGKKPSGILLERLEKGVELYRLKRVQKLLLSGDNAGIYYDEVNVMKDFCLKKGVSPDDIFLDHAGMRTLDSIYRAKHIFEARDIIIVTQKLFMGRALFLANSYGLPAHGYLADSERVQITINMKIREFLARYLAILDVYFLKSGPAFLGKKTPLTGSGRATWNRDVR